MATPEVQDFLTKLRSGDRQAIEEILRQQEPFLRRAIRLRLIDKRLRRVVDTTDILQSLLKDFLYQKQKEHLPAGALGGELAAWLTKAVHHKIRTRMRKECRGRGSPLPNKVEPVSPEPSVARQMELRETIQDNRARLSEKERWLFDLWAQGLPWEQIAEQVGARPDTLRMRLRRALARVLRELGHTE
jgi:RNA polymerase sigma factor (sigma-70 family)